MVVPLRDKPPSTYRAHANDDAKKDDASSYYDVYKDYNATLRAWFVAFGAGGPAFLLANGAITQSLKSEGHLQAVVGAFFVGVFAQIVLVMINKSCAWMNYYVKETGGAHRLAALASWLSEQYWIDFSADAITLVAFGWAVYMIAHVALAA